MITYLLLISLFISNYFSGDCCNPALRINVIDVDGFISQCELSFSNGESVQSAEVVSVSTNESVSFCQMLEIFKLIKSKYVIILSKRYIKLYSVRRRCDHLVVRFTTTYANSANHH
jgi:hypothetical protein